jgi:hypothetical protein
MKLNVLLNQMFTRLGVDSSTSEALLILGNANLATVEVPETISNKLSAEFFTKEAALQHPEIRSTIKAETLNGIDSQTKEILSKYEFDEETKKSIMSEEKTAKRLAKLTDSLYEKASKNRKGDDKEIAALNEKILAERTAYEAKVSDLEKARKMDRVNWELDGIYGSLDYATPMEKDYSIAAAKAIISRISQTKGINFDVSENGVKLVNSDGRDYYENNMQMTPNDFIKKSLIEAKMIKVNEQKQENVQKTRSSVSADQSATNTGFNSKLDSLINSYNK